MSEKFWRWETIEQREFEGEEQRRKEKLGEKRNNEGKIKFGGKKNNKEEEE